VRQRLNVHHHAPKQIDPSASGRAIARAGEEKGIRCNVIAPGFMDTPMRRDASVPTGR
jgi:hypothetical protein